MKQIDKEMKSEFMVYFNIVSISWLIIWNLCIIDYNIEMNYDVNISLTYLSSIWNEMTNKKFCEFLNLCNSFIAGKDIFFEGCAVCCREKKVLLIKEQNKIVMCFTLYVFWSVMWIYISLLFFSILDRPKKNGSGSRFDLKSRKYQRFKHFFPMQNIW